MSTRPILTQAQDILMPLRCVFCGEPTRDDERYVCADCCDDLPWIESPPPAKASLFEAEIRPLAYAFPVDAAIKALKFGRKLFYGPALAQLLLPACERLPDEVDAVLPVPLHWRRKWWRGFNQAREIALPIAKHLGLPIIEPVRRRRATPPQSGLDAHTRVRNLRHAFELARPVRAAHVLVVDDVITTGTTIRELARVLRHSGVPRVSALAVAKA